MHLYVLAVFVNMNKFHLVTQSQQEQEQHLDFLIMEQNHDR